MGKEKKSFVFNCEWQEVLMEYPAEVRLEVYDAIIEYVASGKLSELKPLAKMAFSFIKKEIDYNQNKYEEVAAKRSEAGKKGMASRYGGKQDATRQPVTNDNKANKNYQAVTNLTYNDNDNDIKKKPSTNVEGEKEAANAAPPAPGQGDSLPDAGPCHEAGGCYAPAAGSPDKGVATARAGNGTKGADGDDATTQTPHRSRAKDMAGRMADFQREVCAYGDKYPQELLEAFFNYWSETNRAGTKMRFELERTWDTARRLATWARKEQDYAKNRRSNGNRDAKQEANEYAVRGLMERIAARRSGTLDEGERPF